MELDPFVLSRIQFAANITFHILFPTITIGLGWFLLFFRVRFTQTGNLYWEHAYNFWVKVYALTFALGVVSGITMSFQFGTNWPGFMERTGNIAGPLLGYEVLTAFFLEASFLGIMLFGKQRVSNRTHLISTFLVAFGTSLSAFWILALNSWMHTPAGYTIEEGQFFAESWSAIIFNPSFPYRFTHMMLASLLTSAFLVAGVCAWRIRQGVDGPATKMVLKSGIYTAALVIPLQILAGDLHGLNTLEHQPAKVAAMEAVWETEQGAGFTIVGIPDAEARKTHFAIKIPYAASLILTHDPKGEVKGLNDFEAHPPVGPVFWSFRVMIGVGTLMLLISWWSAWQLSRRGALSSLALSAVAWMTFSGWVASVAGWYVTEIGRQPWIVQGLVSTADVVAQHPTATVAGTLFGYVGLYLALMVAYMKALRIMALKPAKRLEEDSNPLGSPLVGAAT